MIEFLVSAIIVGIIIYGVVCGWCLCQQRQKEQGAVASNNSGGQNEPFYWMTVGSWYNKDQSNVDDNTNDSRYDYDDHIDF